MPDGEGGGGGGGGGGSSECLPMDDLVEAMLRNSQALAEALAADRARREAADRIQRESWEATLKEKDAEIERLRAEAADANKKLQADASRKMKWEAAHELLLGANQKLAELRDADMEDSRTCAETPNSKEVESCTKFSQNTVDHTARDFRKLKHGYKTLSSKKDKKVSVLLSENDSLHTQLDIMKQDNAELLKNKKVEAARALKLQKSVDELKVLTRKKEDEISRLQAEAVEAKRDHDKDISALLSEKDSVHSQLSIVQKDYAEFLKSKKVLNRKKDHEIVMLRAEVVGARKKVQQMHSRVKEKDDEIERLKGWHTESIQKHYSDISQTHKESRSVDPVVYRRAKLKNTHLRQIVEEDYMSETKIVENNGQEECTQKRRRTSSMSNDYEKSGSDEPIGSEEDGDKHTGSHEDDDKKSGSDEDGAAQSGSEEDGDKQTGSDKDGDKQTGSDEDDSEQSGSGEDSDGNDNDEQSGSDEETTHNFVPKHIRNNPCLLHIPKRDIMAWWCWKAPAPLRSKKLEIINGRRCFKVTGHWGQFVKAVNDSFVDQPDKHKEFVRFLRNFEDWRIRDVASTMKVLLDGQPKLTREFNRFLPNKCQIYVKEEEEEKQQPKVEEPV